MTDARSRANQSLYLGKIVLSAWRQKLDEEGVPASTLQLAFHPATVGHLKSAYGWFLLEVADMEVAPRGNPPACVQEVPPLPEGRAQCAELRELERREQEGFLLPLEDMVAGERRRANNPNALATVDNSGPGYSDIEGWVSDFEGICERMRNSLDEC